MRSNQTSAKRPDPVDTVEAQSAGIAEPQTMAPKDMSAFGEFCGATLARAHTRSGDRIAIAAYLGGGDALGALTVFAEGIADQNERDDQQALTDAVRTGRVPAQTG